jgi:hypothetical protein
MSLTFVRASGQYAEAAGNPLGSGTVTVFTIACWYKPSSIANGTALGIGDTNSSQYLALGMNGSGAAFVELTGQTATAGTLSNGTWAHIAGVQSSVTSRIAYKDGVAGSAQTVSTDFTGADRITAGGLMLNGSRLSFAGGSVAHCAVWSTALSGADVASLAAGARPDAVQAGSLVFYSEIDGNASPEDDLVGALDLVWGAGGAAPTKGADDPPVGAAAIEVTLTPVTITTVAQPITVVKRPALTPAATTDAAVALTRSKRPVLTPVAVSDAVQALRVAKHKTLTPVALTDTPVALTGAKAPGLSPVTLSDAAQALSVLKPIHKTLTPVGLLDTAVALAILGAAPLWSYGGDDAPAFTYGGDDIPDWTYGGD